jgi:hypothetical protein
MQRIIRELIAAGYLQRLPQSFVKGHRFSELDYRVTDKPQPRDLEALAAGIRNRRKRIRPQAGIQPPEPQAGIQPPESDTASTPCVVDNSSSEGLSPRAGFQPAYLKRRLKLSGQPRKQADPDRGRIEMEIAQRLGPGGLDVLAALADTEVEQLCDRQRDGMLDDAILAELRLRSLSASADAERVV